jgi:hypothetical protein
MGFQDLDCPLIGRPQRFVFGMPFHATSDHGNHDHFSAKAQERLWIAEQIADLTGTRG